MDKFKIIQLKQPRFAKDAAYGIIFYIGRYNIMSKQLSTFKSLEGISNLYIAHKASLRCTAVLLADNSLCLFSPVYGLGEVALNSLKQIGPVKFLLAPNHYHNKGLKEYVNAFPDATLCCSDAARPRLEKVSGLKLESLDVLSGRFKPHIQLLEPDGLKTGEVWLRISEKDKTGWLLVDAFCGAQGPKSPVYSSTPDLLKTFPNFGVRDKQAYSDWAMAQIKLDQPELLIPCHGSVVNAHDLPEQLLKLLTDHFPI